VPSLCKEPEVTVMRPPTVVAIGSTILDLTYHIDHAPGPGESVCASESHITPGGKGLLQGLAARRLGANVTLVGAVGDDDRGDVVYRLMETEGISTRFTPRMPSHATRLNLAAVDATGDSSYVQLAHDSPAMLRPYHVATARDAIQGADIVLLTLEPSAVVVETLVDVLATCPRGRPRLYVNPAPAHFIAEKLSRRLLAAADLLTPNFLEGIAVAKLLSPAENLPTVSSGANAMSLARTLRELGLQRACITAGASGCVYFGGATEIQHPGFPVAHPIDTIGASDAFIAALAISLYEGGPIHEALAMASSAAGHSVTVLGGASAMPSMAQVQAFRRAHSTSC
jgi:ribokinase